MFTFTQSTVNYLPVGIVDETTGLGVTGLAYNAAGLAVKLAKSGAAGVTKTLTAPDWVEIGNGWYYVRLSTTDTNTLGSGSVVVTYGAQESLWPFIVGGGFSQSTINYLAVGIMDETSGAGVTGLAYNAPGLSFKLAKAGGAAATKTLTAPDWVEIGNGWYYVRLSTTDTNTLGVGTLIAIYGGVEGAYPFEVEGAGGGSGDTTAPVISNVVEPAATHDFWECDAYDVTPGWRLFQITVQLGNFADRFVAFDGSAFLGRFAADSTRTGAGTSGSPYHVKLRPLGGWPQGVTHQVIARFIDQAGNMTV